MNRFLIVITNKRKLLVCIGAIAFIILSTIFMTTFKFPKAINALGSDITTVVAPEYENKLLKDILSSIVPLDTSILFEDSNRKIGNPYIPETPSATPNDVLHKGTTILYNIVYSDEEYMRPIYSNSWREAYFRGWLSLPQKIISARHMLFTYYGGASNIFDIEGSLGFYPNITIDYHNKINFIVYNFDVEKVALLGTQIVISGNTTQKGVQIISVNVDEVVPSTKGGESLLIQLCTPTGYELDYQNIQYSQNNYENEDFGLVKESADSIDSTPSTTPSADIKNENDIIRGKLTHYISNSTKPIYFQANGSYSTSDLQNPILDLAEGLESSHPLNFTILYNNKKYRTPVFHPEWREHYDRDWCYIPRKMYLNMKRLYIIPSDKETAYDMCGEIGFFEDYPQVSKDCIGLLINNFYVDKISVYENNIFVTATPSRTGMQVISIPQSQLTQHSQYIIRLVTKDFCEVDLDYFKK